MTILLQKALDKIQTLPEPSQDVLATWLLAKLTSDLNESLNDEAWLQLSEGAFDFWNDPEDDIWDTF